MSGALEKLLQLHGVTFAWKDPQAAGGQTGVQQGFIAQDVEKVLPEWVGVDNKGFKTLNTSGIEPMLVESIRTLRMENDVLRERVGVLEANRRPLTSGLGGMGGGLLELGLGMGVFAASRPRRTVKA
jgi:hypothetical protein